MSARLLTGREAAEAVLRELKPRIATLDPQLVVVQVGDDPGSSSYIKQKMKSSGEVGLRSAHEHLPASTTLEQLMNVVDGLNRDADVTGFIVQLPLPDHLQPSVPEIIRAIDPMKDVDGFGACNLGKMFLNTEFEHLPPATPAGIILLLELQDSDRRHARGDRRPQQHRGKASRAHASESRRDSHHLPQQDA
jgi:methylenetetrahydrofolate dehydrogenase (NADP+) / methenyltetrahydrofolate cyclohydrolase